MRDHTGIGLIIVTVKMSCHCGFVIVFDVKYMTLESINDSVFGLTYILYMAPVTLQQYTRLLLWHVPLVTIL